MCYIIAAQDTCVVGMSSHSLPSCHNSPLSQETHYPLALLSPLHSGVWPFGALPSEHSDAQQRGSIVAQRCHHLQSTVILYWYYISYFTGYVCAHNTVQIYYKSIFFRTFWLYIVIYCVGSSKLASNVSLPHKGSTMLTRKSAQLSCGLFTKGSRHHLVLISA